MLRKFWCPAHCRRQRRWRVLASRPISWSTLARNEKELTMKSIVRFPSIDRRILLSSLAMLPILPGSLRLTPARAQAQRDPLPSWNDSALLRSFIIHLSPCSCKSACTIRRAAPASHPHVPHLGRGKAVFVSNPH